MSQTGQTHLKNLAAFAARFLKVCLTILGHYALKGSKFRINHKKTPVLESLFNKVARLNY